MVDFPAERPPFQNSQTVQRQPGQSGQPGQSQTAQPSGMAGPASEAAGGKALDRMSRAQAQAQAGRDLQEAMVAGRRHHARAQVAMLKEQVRTLSVLHMIDPHAFARMATSLAGQLAGAASAYGQGGDGAARPAEDEAADRLFARDVRAVGIQMGLLFEAAMARLDDPGEVRDYRRDYRRAVARVDSALAAIAGSPDSPAMAGKGGGISLLA